MTSYAKGQYFEAAKVVVTGKLADKMTNLQSMTTHEGEACIRRQPTTRIRLICFWALLLCHSPDVNLPFVHSYEQESAIATYVTSLPYQHFRSN